MTADELRQAQSDTARGVVKGWDGLPRIGSKDGPIYLPSRRVCSVCGQDWARGWNHAIWCGGFGRPHGEPVSAALDEED
jgi:hypothetical protein